MSVDDRVAGAAGAADAAGGEGAAGGVFAEVLGLVRDSLWGPDSLDGVLGFAGGRWSAADAGGLLEVLAELQRVVNRLEAWQSVIGAAVAGSGRFVARTPEGGVDASAEAIGLEAGVSKRAAERMIERGVFLGRRESVFGARYAAGEVPSSKMNAVVDVFKDASADAVLVVEAAVGDAYRELSAIGLKREFQRQLIGLVPGEAVEVEERAQARRCVTRPRPDELGMARMSVVLPAASAMRLHEALDRAADAALAAGDGRTRRQLRADVLGHWGGIAQAFAGRLLAPVPVCEEDRAWYEAPLDACEDPVREEDVVRVVDPLGHPVEWPAWLGEDWAQRAVALLGEPEEVPHDARVVDPWGSPGAGEFDPLERYLLTVQPTAVDRADVVQDLVSELDAFELALAEPGLIPPDPTRDPVPAAVTVTVPADILARTADLPGLPAEPDAFTRYMQHEFGPPDANNPGDPPGSPGGVPDGSDDRPNDLGSPPSGVSGSSPGGVSVAWLDGYGPVTAVTAALLAAGGVWRRLVTDPVTGRPLDLGRDRYQPPAYMQDMVRVSQPVCARPGCDRPAAECEIDHAHEWHQGGTTRLDNLQPLCKRCHQLKTTGLLRTRTNPDGTTRWYITTTA